MIRVLVADDQALVRGALAAMLGLESDIAVVAEVGSGDDVLPVARRTRPDVALIDVQMPGADGLTAAAALHAELPSCRVLICTTFAVRVAEDRGWALVGHRGGQPPRIAETVAPGGVMAQAAAADGRAQRRQTHGDDDRDIRAAAADYPDLFVLKSRAQEAAQATLIRASFRPTFR